jgi:hypothetical protein
LVAFNQRWRSCQELLFANARRLSYELATREQRRYKRGLSQSLAAWKAEGPLPESGALRQVQYLNTLVEQDHRFMKRLTRPGMGFFSFETAWRTFQGYEMMNLMRKGHGQGVAKGAVGGQVALVAKRFGVIVSENRRGSLPFHFFLPRSCNTTALSAYIF